MEGMRLTLSGTPTGGILTFGQGGALDRGEPPPGLVGMSAKVTINTHATDTIQAVVARLNAAINAEGSDFAITSSVDEDDSNTVILAGWPFDVLPFLATTDSGLDIQPGVSGFAAVFHEANDRADLTWSIPSGVSYDEIWIARNHKIIAELNGSATSYTHTPPLAFPQNDFSEDALREAYPDFARGYLQYQIVGMTSDRPSDMATVVVQKPVYITTGVLPEGKVGVPYSATVEVVGGITLPITWSLSVSPLPPGLSLDTSNGEVSGTPTEAGEYSCGMSAEDSHTPEPTVHYRIVDLKISN